MPNDVQRSQETYDAVAKGLHWAIAALLSAQFVIGWTMPHIGKGTLPVGEIAWHLTIGVLIILLVAVRVAWRIARPPRAVSADASRLARAARATHALLYLLLVVVPVLGWANANSRDWAVGLTQWLRLPRIMPAGSKLGHDLGDIHSDLAIVLIVVIGLHLVAGLYHHFILRDDTLRKML